MALDKWTELRVVVLLERSARLCQTTELQLAVAVKEHSAIVSKSGSSHSSHESAI